MNGLVVTFVVGGILMVSIIGFSNLMITNSRESALGTMTKERMNSVVDLVTNDFNKVGYQSTSTPIITRMDSTDFRFWSDAFDDDSFGATSLRWRWNTSSADTSSSNPNDFFLQRTGPISNNTIGTVNISVTYFKVRYLDDNSIVTTNPALVRKIEVEVIVESPEPYRYDQEGTPYYYRSAWKRTFVPNNINLPY